MEDIIISDYVLTPKSTHVVTKSLGIIVTSVQTGTLVPHLSAFLMCTRVKT